MEMATLQRQRSTPQMKTIIEQNTKLKRSMDWHDCLCCHWTPSHSSTFARCHPPRKPNQETWHFWQLVSQGNPYWEQPSNVMIRMSMAPVSATVQKCNLHLFRRVALIRVWEYQYFQLLIISINSWWPRHNQRKHIIMFLSNRINHSCTILGRHLFSHSQSGGQQIY